MKRAEHIFLALGLALLLAWTSLHFYSFETSRRAIRSFQAKEQGRRLDRDQSSASVDARLWSNGRISAYEESLGSLTAPPVAILRIPAIELVVPIFNGTDDLVLNRGVGRISGTGEPGQGGNFGIAGHRDGFFRRLGELSPGDLVEVDRQDHADRYIVTGSRIVTPDDVSVLRRTDSPTLTLVTCFPFYFAGPAPERYIVTATFKSSSQSEVTENNGGLSSSITQR